MKNYIKSLISVIGAFVVLSLTAQAQVTITQWTFEGDTTIPAIGNGVASLIGGTTATFASGVTGSPDRAWNSSGYPAQGVGSGTAGVEFLVSTGDYKQISVSWDGRHSNTSANRIRLQYTTDGLTWINFEANAANAINMAAGVDKGFDNGRYIADAGDTWYQRAADLSGINGVASNTVFGIRMVTEFVDGVEYGVSTPTSNYGTGGTLRYDNVTFRGIFDPIGVFNPEIRLVRIYTYGNLLSIESVESLKGEVQIYNFEGQQVAGYTLRGTNASFNLNVPAGIYIVQIISDKGSYRSKVMVN